MKSEENYSQNNPGEQQPDISDLSSLMLEENFLAKQEENNFKNKIEE